MFRLGPNEVIDASVRGCRARYINHSCDPNCFAVITLPTQHEATISMPIPQFSETMVVDTEGHFDDAHRQADTPLARTDTRPRRSSSRNTGLGGRYWSVEQSRRGSGAPSESQLSVGGVSCSGPYHGTALSGRRVFVYALRPIQKGEELTYDYSFSSSEKAVACRCRSANCRGTLNVQ